MNVVPTANMPGTANRFNDVVATSTNDVRAVGYYGPNPTEHTLVEHWDGSTWLIQDALGLLVAIVGLVPLVAGTFDACLVAPLFDAPLSGAKVRATAPQPTITKSR